MRRSIVVLAILLVSIAAPAAAASPFEERSLEKGQGAFADSYDCTLDAPATGDETCEFTFVSAFDGRSSFNGDSFQGERLCVSIGTFVFDDSTGTWTDTFQYGCDEQAGVDIPRSLATASGEGEVPTESQTCTYDVTTDEFECSDPVAAGELSVSVEWEAISPLRRGSFRERSEYGDCVFSYFSKGTSREAVATGTIDGSSVSFDWAEINSGSNRSSTRCH